MKRIETLTNILGFAALSLATTAQANITIDVTPSSGPNGYGSPSYAAYAANAIYALENGLASYGDPSLPSYYTQAPSVMSVMNNLVTSFTSWNGVANPSGVYAGEYGNRLLFGLDVKGNGQKISIDQLSFVMSSIRMAIRLGTPILAGTVTVRNMLDGITVPMDCEAPAMTSSSPPDSLPNRLMKSWAVAPVTLGGHCSQTIRRLLSSK